MAGLFALSVDPKNKKNFPKDLFWGTFYQQHLGEDWSGLGIWNGKEIEPPRTQPGLFRFSFSEDMITPGTEGIGYCGESREPILIDSRLGKICACFCGNIINREKLVERFKNFGHSFSWEGKDIEVIVKLIIKGVDIVDGIKKMTDEIEGTYSLLILSSEGIYAACSPDGHWPFSYRSKRRSGNSCF